MKHSETSFNTKKTLANALKDVIAQKSLDRISISDIVRRAGVNRKTFYYHFDDVYGLMAWILRTEVISNINKLSVVSDYRKGIAFVMDYIEQNQDLIVRIAQSSARNEIRELLCESIHMSLENAFEEIEQYQNNKFDDDFTAFIVDFFTEAIAGMISRYAENPNARSREQIENYLIRIFDDVVAQLKQM